MFDPAKRDKTLGERGLGFEHAIEVFAHETLTVADDRADYGEDRFITVGWLDERMVVLVWTSRHGIRRIISMRKAIEREQKIYGHRLGR